MKQFSRRSRVTNVENNLMVTRIERRRGINWEIRIDFTHWCSVWFSSPWTLVCQACLSLTISCSLLKVRSIELVMPSNHLIFYCPLLLLPSIFPSISQVFSNDTSFYIRWPQYCSFSFRITISNEYSGLIPLAWIGLISLLSKELSRVFTSTTVQKHSFFDVQPSLLSTSHICDYWKHHSFD